MNRYFDFTNKRYGKILYFRETDNGLERTSNVFFEKIIYELTCEIYIHLDKMFSDKDDPRVIIKSWVQCDGFLFPFEIEINGKIVEYDEVGISPVLKVQDKHWPSLIHEIERLINAQR